MYWHLINKYNYYIFDLDGTLAETSVDIINCLKKTFYELNILTDDLDRRISSSVVGPPLKEMIQSLNLMINDNEIDMVISKFRKIYVESGFPKTFLYSGIRNVLDLLYSEKKSILIATNKASNPTMKILQKLSIENLFTDIICGDTNNVNINKYEMLKLSISKWNLKKDETIMIGDSASDIIAAKKNHISSIGILSGYGDINDILNQEPDYKINSHTELINLIKQMM